MEGDTGSRNTAQRQTQNRPLFCDTKWLLINFSDIFVCFIAPGTSNTFMSHLFRLKKYVRSLKCNISWIGCALVPQVNSSDFHFKHTT